MVAMVIWEAAMWLLGSLYGVPRGCYAATMQLLSDYQQRVQGGC